MDSMQDHRRNYAACTSAKQQGQELSLESESRQAQSLNYPYNAVMVQVIRIHLGSRGFRNGKMTLSSSLVPSIISEIAIDPTTACEWQANGGERGHGSGSLCKRFF